ncbi:MAG: hypothetical protein JF607_04915 [Burkholderiales bacterium]|nr:hypothetical protein [Burkholderiales bacterium]
MKRPPPRQLALFGTLGLSLVATAWMALDDAPEPIAAAPRRALATAAAAQADWPGPAASARAEWPALDAQARSAWGDAAPVAAAPASLPPAEAAAEEAQAPTAPPFPYQLVGRLTDSRPRAILNNAQRSAVVGVGEVVDGQWRVDAIEAGGLRLTFLPLGQAQFIPFAASTAA